MMARGSVDVMSEADAMARVLRDPELDAPRLAFAAAVGGDRALLIDHGIRARDARRKRFDIAAFGYEKQERLLLQQHPEWTAPVRALADAVHVGRGFVEGVTLSLDAWLERGRDLVALAPILHLKLAKVQGRVAELAVDPMLAHVRSLDLAACQLDDNDLRALVDSSHLAQLRWLSLAGNQIGTEGQAALAAATPRLPGLRYVDLALNPAPTPTDESVVGEDGRARWWPRDEGVALEEHHGPLPWLHANYLDPDRQIFYVT